MDLAKEKSEEYMCGDNVQQIDFITEVLVVRCRN